MTPIIRRAGEDVYEVERQLPPVWIRLCELAALQAAGSFLMERISQPWTVFGKPPKKMYCIIIMIIIMIIIIIFIIIIMISIYIYINIIMYRYVCA